LDDYVPDSDKALAEARVISFNSLPRWWIDSRTVMVAEPALATVTPEPDTSATQDASSDVKTYQSNKQKKRDQYTSKE